MRASEEFHMREAYTDRAFVTAIQAFVKNAAMRLCRAATLDGQTLLRMAYKDHYTTKLETGRHYHI